MSRLLGWARGTTPKPSAHSSAAQSQEDLLAQQIAVIEDAMAHVSLMMNDDIEGAEEGLRKGSSTFHSLGMGVCIFMRSILGFEKSVMLEASNRLYDTENAAWNEMKKAQKEAGSSTTLPGKIYPPGSEHAIVLAEAQLMSAIVAVLHESLTEGIKGFYKLRKAYLALDAIIESESTYLKQQGIQLENGTDIMLSTTAPTPATSADDDDDLEFTDAAESGIPTPDEYEGHLAKDEGSSIAEKMGQLSVKGDKKLQTAKSPGTPETASDVFTNPIDAFVHSGANMCFGILLLIISMVPPAFSRLLSIIGFRGDRERGVQMLWQSTRFENINGAVAGLMILAYYNGLLGFSDILPSDDDVENGAVMGYPKTRCAALLATMRQRYPDSGLWRLEEARVLAVKKELREAITILQNNKESKMRQVTALNSFELSLDAMYTQDFPLMRDSFLRCIELNDWSHSMYYYLAGAAELELYRDAVHSTTENNESEIRLHKKKAEEYFRKAPTVAGKKRFMSKPLPFEQFVLRKLQKWEERATDLGVDFIDAAGVSPAFEMTYLWNGTKKMQRPELDRAEQLLSWQRLTVPAVAAAKIQCEIDEGALHKVCLSAVYRNQERIVEATDILKDVLAINKLDIKGPTRDDYALPAAHYEMAVISWVELQNPKLRKSESLDNTKAEEEAWKRKKLDECHSWLDGVAKWEAYILDARFGMRVNTGQDTLNWYRREHPWAAAAATTA
ncbi:Iml2/Tetratricopeptide repeat protein 39 [Microdochium nivale]|nr:Iml2/Tetratricopeptide repeat protein 39 [Microdochium nivale]